MKTSKWSKKNKVKEQAGVVMEQSTDAEDTERMI